MNDIIELAKSTGNLPMQVLILIAVIVLGRVVRNLYRESLAKQKEYNLENQKIQSEWMLRIESERAAMTQERRDRITMLLDLIKDDVQVKQDLKAAIDNNTKAIERLEDFIEKQAEVTQELFRSVVQEKTKK